MACLRSAACFDCRRCPGLAWLQSWGRALNRSRATDLDREPWRNLGGVSPILRQGSVPSPAQASWRWPAPAPLAQQLSLGPAESTKGTETVGQRILGARSGPDAGRRRERLAALLSPVSGDLDPRRFATAASPLRLVWLLPGFAGAGIAPCLPGPGRWKPCTEGLHRSASQTDPGHPAARPQSSRSTAAAKVVGRGLIAATSRTASRGASRGR